MDVFHPLSSLFLRNHKCLLCSAIIEQSGTKARFICSGCESDLPRIRAACERCGLALPLSAPVCGHCINEPPSYASCRALFQYQHPIDHLITHFKQHNNLPIKRWLIQEVTKAGKELAEQHHWDAVIPVPLHWRRLWQRGFNQSFEISQALAKELQCPVLTIRRVRYTPNQKTLSKKLRLKNLANTFRAGNGVRGLKILVVDDVITTGATANAVAENLYLAGAQHIDIFALARTPKPTDR